MSERNNHSKQGVNSQRRRFLVRVLQAATCGIGTAAIYGYLRDAVGPQTYGKSTTELTTLPRWDGRESVPALVAVKQVDNRPKAVEAALDALGGVTKFIGRGDRVLLKVNAAFATPAELGATTHPDLVRALVTLCYKAGAAEVIVADNPINAAESCFRLSGIGAAAEAAGAKVILPRQSAFRNFSLEGGELIRRWPLFYEPLSRATKVIGVAPVKHHNRSGASMTMKNWYGLLGGRRNVFHQDINTIVCELARMVRPTFVVLDGITVMMRNGPTGGSLSDLEARRTLIVSTDQVAADTYGAALLGLTVADLPYLALAEQAGVGTTNYRTLNFHELELGAS
ncbi:MAG: DUF362 domain-containing protein [Candidatus Sumerlaeaceae bacterium]|nr:DUF362 domain-containing protein [Candidatus Sumerlaeaceae bacterium]